MQHTLFAVFDKRIDALGAMDELLLSGFSQQDLRLSEETSSIDPSPELEDEGIGASIKHFFSDLFGSDSDYHSNKYATAVHKGHHVLTVTASDEPGVERAADIVERFGPVDIDEKISEWSGGASILDSGAMRMGSPGAMQQSQGISLQFHDDRHLFAQQSLNDERPMGQTYQETMDVGEPLSVSPFAMREVQRGSVRVFSPQVNEDSDYRSHWDSTYAASGSTYDAYAPAYSFGHEMAQMYRGQPWNDVESDLRSQWESRDSSAGASTWEQFKGAIRHGWDRLTS